MKYYWFSFLFDISVKFIKILNVLNILGEFNID